MSFRAGGDGPCGRAVETPCVCPLKLKGDPGLLKLYVKERRGLGSIETPWSAEKEEKMAF